MKRRLKIAYRKDLIVFPGTGLSVFGVVSFVATPQNSEKCYIIVAGRSGKCTSNPAESLSNNPKWTPLSE